MVLPVLPARSAGTQTRGREIPKGFASGRRYPRPKGGAWNEGHLLGARLGGSNREPRNLVAMHAYADSRVMRQVENDVRAAADRGETITHNNKPSYRTNDPSDVVPAGVTIEAHGNRGFRFTPWAQPARPVTTLNEPRPEER
ncbi:DNA/RNA non-specific endonuclease [Streptomyces actinomycinicus]|uniref:DNA/RNA non-specific endonuclease n=1 Tax=Streptomyces actinomycinicus TaxID=1695166 RepID=UPI0027DA1933|nr:DNA/RNA non-specific endonuclease [Streptomyces actinomycinicus]